MRNFPALGFDPAPGHVDAASELAGQYTRAGRLMSDAHGLMARSLHTASGWAGAASEAFHGLAAEAPAKMTRAVTALEDAGGALTTWAADLASMQVTADDLEARAEQAQRRLDEANADPDVGRSPADFPPEDQARGARIIEAARAEVTLAAEELAEIRAQARRLFAQHEELAAAVAAKLEAPVFPPWFDPNDPLRPVREFFDDLFDTIGGKVDDIQHDFKNFLEDNANVINETSNVVSDLATVTGTIGLAFDITGAGAPAGAVLGTFSAALSGVALAGHSLAAYGGAEGAAAAAKNDALGLATFGVGKVGGRLLKPAGKIAGKLAKVIDHPPKNLKEAWDTAGEIHGVIQTTAVETVQDAGDHFEKYWDPRKPEPLPVTIVSTFALPARAFYHAYEIGRAKDLENR